MRASNLSRYLEIPRETARRHLNTLTKLRLLGRDDSTFSAGESIRQVPGFDVLFKSITDTIAKLM